MTAKYIKNMNTYEITLTRKEAEALAYSSTCYDILLTALHLNCWEDVETFRIYGNKFQVAADLAKAMKKA
ncbi:MAG: hypothetical protein LIO95_05010 [Clostridiales bacterium]|nr:hypothetical protein [Clostridiales bacterium]